MKIIFSHHATLRITRRKIQTEAILDTITNPDKVLSSFRGRKLYRKKLNGKIVEVVTIEEDKKIIVITTYYL